MPKFVPNDALSDVAPLPESFDFGELRSDLFAPRISFAVKSLATDPSAILFVHYENLAKVLNTSKDSRAVRNAFELLIDRKYIEKVSVPLIYTSRMNIVRLTKSGQALAVDLGYALTPNDWEVILLSRKNTGEKYIGQVLQIAYQCRVREIPVKIVPWIVSDNPPDLLIGDEERWVYASGTQKLNQKILTKLSNSAKAAGNHPVGLISK